jgi:hypothetical protein
LFARLEESTMRMLALAVLISVTACDGPRENAGENADFAAGVVNSPDTLRQGPAEKLGEAQDMAAKRAEEAKEAEAKALEAAADEKRAEADQEADALEQQADAVRNN